MHPARIPRSGSMISETNPPTSNVRGTDGPTTQDTTRAMVFHFYSQINQPARLDTVEEPLEVPMDADRT